MDDALVQDDGIDLIVEELDRCWEVTQDKKTASKIEKPSSRHRVKMKLAESSRDKVVMWTGGSYTTTTSCEHWGGWIALRCDLEQVTKRQDRTDIFH